MFRLIAPRLNNSRVKRANLWVRLWSHRVDHSVDRSPCASHGAVRDVLGGNYRAFRDVPRRADRPSLSAVNAGNAETEREKY